MAARVQLVVLAAGLIIAAAGVRAGTITLTVGDALTPTLFAAANAANADPANDYVVLIPAGTYTNDFARVTRPMTIEASGGPVTLRADGALLDSKGIIVTTSSLTVKGLTFEGAAISDALGGNGAGIRDQSNGATTLRVENSTFTNNQNGILTSSDTGSTYQETVEIIGSSFFGNGSGTGQTHAAYIGDALSLLVSNSLFCGTLVGHDIKSRAMSTTVTNSTVYDGATGPGCSTAGSASYGIEATNGGQVTIDGVTLVQGSATDNTTMLRYGADGLYPNSSLFVSNSTFTSGNFGTGIQAPAGATGCTLSNTTFTGLNTNVSPPSFCTSTQPPSDPVAVGEPGTLALLLTAALGWASVLLMLDRRGAGRGLHGMRTPGRWRLCGAGT
jgi:hypothetical protein